MVLFKFLKNTAIYGISPQINFIASVIALPFITKYFNEFDFGIQGTVLAYVAAFSSLSSLGLKMILTNTFFKHKSSFLLVWRQLYGFLVLWNILFSFLLFVLIYNFIPESIVADRFLLAVLVVLPNVFFSITKTLGSLYLQYSERPIAVAWRVLAFGLLSIGLQLLFIVHFKMHFLGWFLAFAIAGMLSNISYLYLVVSRLNLKPIFRFKTRLILNSLRITLPIIPHQYSTYLLNSSDRIVMDRMQVSTDDIGLYNVANTFGSLLEGLSLATTLALNPWVNKAYAEKKDVNVRYIIYSLQIFYYLCTFNLAIWLREIFSVLLNNVNLVATYPLGIVLIMSYNFRPVYYGVIGKLFFAEKTKNLWKMSFSMGVLNIILNILLIPIYGYKVAALTTFACFYLLSIIPQFTKEYKQIVSIKFNSLIFILISIALTVVAFIFRDFSQLIKFALSGTFSVIFVSMLWSFSKKIKL